VVVGVVVWDLHIYEARSLKDKRAVVQSLKARLRDRLNVAVAETGQQDLWQRAELAACTVATDRRQASAILDRADRMVEAETRARIIDSHRSFL
jgi:uncharacterized protein